MKRTALVLVMAVSLIGTSAPAWASTSRKSSSIPTAKTVVQDLIARGLPAKLAIVYTAATDPNHLLGRPNGYTSKAAFTDSRVQPSSVSDPSLGSVDLGGSVEVYPNAAGAKARAAYLASIEKSDPILGTEYDYLNGSVLLRVSHYLTPSQAKGYEQALAKLGDGSTHAPASPAHKAKAPKLGTLLLSIGQMPTGWSVDNSSSSGGGVGCYNSRFMEPKGVTQTAKTAVYFQSNAANGLPAVNEKLATYSNTSSAYKKIVTTISNCKSFSGKYQGHNMVGTVGQMSFRTYGTSSEAFAVDFTYAGTALYEDSLIVLKGNVVMSINEGNSSPVNVKQFQGFIAKAVAKLP